MRQVVTHHAIRRLAGARSHERGVDYFRRGLVESLIEDAGAVRARVLGARAYEVELRVEDGSLAFSCTCPVYDDGSFCKHCVAVALAYLVRQDEVASSTEHRRGGKGKRTDEHMVTLDDVRDYLSAQDKGALVELIMQQATNDDRLRERLLMKTGRSGGTSPDLRAFRRAIDRAVDTGDFVDYYSVWDYARSIHEVIDTVEELLREGYAVEAIDLAEYALAAVEDVMESVDDSDGEMGGILGRLQQIHHAACAEAKPDPEELARRLFAWELQTDWDTFLGAAATYADVLAEKGLAAYRRLAEAEWKGIPALKPGQDDAERYGKRFRITHIMETLTRKSGDIEALVAIKSRDLSHAFSFLEIAEIYRDARRHDKALEWAEAGVEAFPTRTDSRLREFLADEYHRSGRHDEAMTIMWAEFADWPHLEAYQKLKSHAQRAGTWSEWRDRALAFVRESINRKKSEVQQDRQAWLPAADHGC